MTADNTINRVENSILEDSCVTVRETAAELSLSVRYVEKIIREHLKFRKVIGARFYGPSCMSVYRAREGEPPHG